MTINEKLTNRIREALSHLPHVEEKRMFSGITFMVNGKMCIVVRDDNAMFRIEPARHEELVERTGASTMIMKSRDYIGYINVDEDALRYKKELDYWINLALDYNPQAKSSKKK